MLVRRGRPAMATLFEVWLGGDDEEHLAAVAEAALEEIARVERLLSRFDPAAEVARVNREATTRPVRVDRELLAILIRCRSWFDRTDGFFDICAGGPTGYGRAVRVDEEAGTVRLLDPAARLDLGGYGKGHALDAALRVVDGFGVASAFLHGGTSSALARGRDEGGRPWRVGIRDPLAHDPDRELDLVELIDGGLSSSAAFRPSMGVSDVIDPTVGEPRREQEGVSVVATSAAEAEVYSTALLAMGRERAGRFLHQGRRDGLRVAWIDRGGIEWLGEPSGEACHAAGASGTA